MHVLRVVNFHMHPASILYPGVGACRCSRLPLGRCQGYELGYRPTGQRRLHMTKRLAPGQWYLAWLDEI